MQERLLRLPRRVRLVYLPAALLLAVAGLTFGLAQLHPAKPETRAPAAGTPVELGDAERGELLFAERCASCHGAGGTGGRVGPTLAGNTVSLAEAKATIDAGRGAMPGGLVTGDEQRDLLAYLDTILAAGG